MTEVLHMGYGKVQQRMNDVVGDNVKKLAQLFPSAVKDGEVDFEALKEELGQFTEVDGEKYELTWAGKKNAKKIAQEDIVGKTLKFIPEDSRNADNTENLYIKGENLEVLKLLRQNYYGAVKMIYIDPPYNTGNDFVYNDDYSITQEEIDEIEGNIDEFKARFTINSENGNRFHARWLNNFYSRVKIAKDFLNEDGVILVSIGDKELANALEVMNEIYGERNQVCIFVWKSRAKPTNAGNSKFRPQKVAEYILVYSKSNPENMIFNVISAKERVYPHEDALGKYRTTTILTSNRGTFRRETMRFESGGYIPDEDYRWKAGKKTIDELFSTNHMIMNEDGVPLEKKYEHEEDSPLYPIYCYIDNELSGTAENGKSELNALIGNKHGFDTVKPVQLIKYLLQTFANKDSLIMDFFSGSATTAQAIMELNAEDDGERRFILIQCREKYKDESETYLAGFKDVCDVALKRLNCVCDVCKESNRDFGYKVFEVSQSNIKWNSLMDAGQLDMAQIESTPDLVDFMPDANDVDIVYELMLRQRDVPLSETLEQLSDIGNRTYLYASSYLVCLETEITVELINKLAELDPLSIKFIFRDSAFKDDIALKDEAFRRLKALIEKNAGNSKVTYTVEFI